MINEALASEDPYSLVPSVDNNGHGTFLASIAAGSGDPDAQFIGAAPESVIAVVKLKQAKQYLRDYYFIPNTALLFRKMISCLVCAISTCLPKNWDFL